MTPDASFTPNPAAPLILVHDHLSIWDDNLPRIRLRIDRFTLGKRRWRGTAEDGVEFGFDLAHPLESGDVFHQGEFGTYAIEQKAEAVLELPLGQTLESAARLGWLFGNLHFPIQITEQTVRLADDPAIRQVCEREALSYTLREEVFVPLRAGHAHAHEH